MTNPVIKDDDVVKYKTIPGHYLLNGLWKCQTYKAWEDMIARCYDPEHPLYPTHGGRGITVCEQWRGENGFQQFLEDMGPCPDDNNYKNSKKEN